MKRLTGLLLTLVMLMGLMPAGAAQTEELTACGPVGFKDTELIHYGTAVAVTAGLGLFSGTADGRFDPQGKVTRAQMATVVVKMLKGSGFNADVYRGGRDCTGDPFPDTAEFEGGWAEGYINACRQMGVVSGYPDGTFQPEKEVTAAEALTMFVNALKSDPGEGEWPDTVMRRAEKMGLYASLDAAPAAGEVLNREQLAAIIYQVVCWSASGSTSTADGVCKVGKNTLASTVFGVSTIRFDHQYDETAKRCTVCGAP